MKLMNNKGMDGGSVFSALGSLGIGIAVLGITLIVTFLILSKGRSQASAAEGIVYNNTDCIKSLTCNATGILTNAAQDVPGWIPLVVIAFVGAVILGLIKLFR